MWLKVLSATLCEQTPNHATTLQDLVNLPPKCNYLITVEFSVPPNALQIMAVLCAVLIVYLVCEAYEISSACHYEVIEVQPMLFTRRFLSYSRLQTSGLESQRGRSEV